MTPASILPLLLSLFIGQTDRPPPLTFDKHVDYIAWYNEFVSKGKTDNACEAYKELNPDKDGASRFPLLEGPAKDQFDKAISQVWKPDDYPELSAHLKEYSPLLKTFAKAVERRDFWQPAEVDAKLLIAVPMPALVSSRTMCRAVLARAMMQQEDQSKAVIDASRAVLRSADHMQQSGVLVGAFVGLAERTLVYQVATAALRDGVIAEGDIATLYTTMRRFDPRTPDPGRWLAFEWATPLDTLQFLCPDGKYHAARWGDFQRTISQLDPSAKATPKAFDPQEAAHLIDQYFQGAAEILSGPLSLGTARRLGELSREQSAKLSENSFTAAFMPVFDRAYMLQLRGEAHRRGTLVVLALHAHRAKHGKWPKSLDKIDKQLGLKGLKELLEDPFSGKDFVYKIKNGEPLLYTVSLNGTDDGGHHDGKWGEGEIESDYVFWPVQR